MCKAVHVSVVRLRPAVETVLDAEVDVLLWVTEAIKDRGSIVGVKGEEMLGNHELILPTKAGLNHRLITFKELPRYLDMSAHVADRLDISLVDPSVDLRTLLRKRPAR